MMQHGVLLPLWFGKEIQEEPPEDPPFAAVRSSKRVRDLSVNFFYSKDDQLL